MQLELARELCAARRDLEAAVVTAPSGRRKAGASQVKDIRTGDQVDADAATWTPPPADLRPHIISTAGPEAPTSSTATNSEENQ